MYMLVHRIPLVPVFAFGENDLYKQVANQPGSRLRRFQTLATKLLTFSLPLFYGRGIFNYTFGFLPFSGPVNVIGRKSALLYMWKLCCRYVQQKIMQKYYSKSQRILVSFLPFNGCFFQVNLC